MLTTTFTGDSNELNVEFLERIKAMFKGKRIDLLITESQETDESEYPYNNPAQVKHLLAVIADIKERKNLVSFDRNAFQ